MYQPVCAEPHFTPQELAKQWKVSTQTIRRLFADEPGVLVFGSPEKKHKRPYVSIRIPQSVAQRVHSRKLGAKK